jgi:hypothetical protein
VELDGIEVVPITARGVYLNIGQRASVIITANQTAGNYYIRATLPRTCFLPYAPYTSAGLATGEYAAKGILSYDDVPVESTPIGVMVNVSNPYGSENNGARGDVWEGCDDMPFDLPKPLREIPAYEVPEQNKHYIEYVFRQAQDVNRIFVNKVCASLLMQPCQDFYVVSVYLSALDCSSLFSYTPFFSSSQAQFPGLISHRPAPTARVGRCITP